MKILKNIGFFLLVIVGMTLTQSLIGIYGNNEVYSEKNQDDDKKVKIKIIKIVDGKETVIDTTIVLPDGMTLPEALKEFNIELSDGCNMQADANPEIYNIQINEDDDTSGMHKIKCVKKIIIRGDSDDIDLGDCDKNVMMLIRDGKGNGKCETTFINGHEMPDSLCCKKNIIINNGAKTMKCVVVGNDSIKIENLPCDGLEKNMVVKIESDDDGNLSKKIWISENGDVHEFEGDVDVNVIKDDDKTVMIIAKLKMGDLDENDKKVLKKAGIDSNNNELEMKSFAFSPNPNNGKFNLKFETESNDNVRIQVIDSNGRNVYNENLKNHQGTYSKDIDISGNTNGIYFLNITQNGKSLTKKVVLQ